MIITTTIPYIYYYFCILFIKPNNHNNSKQQVQKMASFSPDYLKVSEELLSKGFSIIDLADVHHLDSSILFAWESKFREAFNLSEDMKIEAGVYHSSDSSGLAVGYRKDECREFFETRLKDITFEHTSVCTPNLPLEGYASTVVSMCTLLGAIGFELLSLVAERCLRIDPKCLTDLTDLPFLLNKCTEMTPLPLTSSVLRICSYPNEAHHTSTDPVDNTIAFGSHTDTSFLTVSPCSSIPGIEIYDVEERTWMTPEVGCKPTQVIVFVGEMLQIITRGVFRAAVHRVRAPSQGESVRVSSPFLIRGLYKATFCPRCEDMNYRHPGGEEALRCLADLEDVSMKEIHRILDYKRLRCVKENQDSGKDWVLSAYGVRVTLPTAG